MLSEESGLFASEYISY